jgi:hypothetical protein
LNIESWRLVRIAMLAGPLPAGTGWPDGPAEGPNPATAEVLTMLSQDGRRDAPSTRGRMAASRFLRLAAIAVLVLVASVAVGAASRPHSVELSLSTPDLGEFAVLALLALAGALGLSLGTQLFPVWLLNPNRPPSVVAKGQRLPAIVRVFLTLIPMMVIAFFLAATRRLSGGSDGPAAHPGALPVVPPDSNSAQATDVFLLVATLVVAVTAFLVAAFLFRRPGPEPVATESRESVVEILDEGLGALLAEHDPRKAVIAAYVAMERAMARKGWARHPHEAPTEYLAHVLGVAPGRAGDLDELVRLYELARFSEHTVTASMRDAAVDAVRRLRVDLQEPA